MPTLLRVGGGGRVVARAMGPAGLCWMTGTVLGLGTSIAWMVNAIRSRHLSVDVIAVMASGGGLAVDEPFAGAVITVMPASGRLLEARVGARAQVGPRRWLRDAPEGEAVAPKDVTELRRLVYGLDGILRLHTPWRMRAPAV